MLRKEGLCNISVLLGYCTRGSMVVVEGTMPVPVPVTVTSAISNKYKTSNKLGGIIS